MSNSGGITPPAPGATKPSAPSGQVVQIQTLPEALTTVSRAIRIEGEVVQQNRDGSVRIRTPQGDVDVTVRGRQPQQGQRLEVDIPAGSPPRTATIRTAPPAPVQPQQPPVQTAPPPATAPLPQTPVIRPAPAAPPPVGNTPAPAPVPTTPLPSPSLPPPQTGGTGQPSAPAPVPAPTAPTVPPSTSAAPQPFPSTAPLPNPAVSGKPQVPLPASYQPTAQAMSKQGTATLPPLMTGQTVRLTPVPPAQSILPSLTTSGNPEQITTSQLGRINFQSGLIAQAAKTSLSATLIQTLKPSLAALPQTMTTTSMATPSLVSPPATGTAPATLLPNVQSIANLLQPMTGAIGKTDIPLLQNLATARPASIDAKIIEVKPLQVQIVSIDGKNTGSIIKPADGNTAMVRPTNIMATVTGFTPQNQPVIAMQLPNVSTPQSFILQFTAGNLSQGSQIILAPQPIGIGAPAVTGLPILKPLMPLMQASTLWPAIDDLFQTFQSSPQGAQALNRLIPSPANRGTLGPAAMVFIAAAKAGELQNWLGDKRLEALQKLGKESLLSRLSGETAPLARSTADAGAGDWRTYPIPLLWQNEISKIMLHMKHEPPEQGKEDQEGSTRFIFDLDLTRMGGVQLDGLLRGKRLDLIIRTQMPISATMQQTMKVAYADALDGTDIYGEIGFQGDLKNWVNVVKREEMLGVSA